jgi:hypothetical protein
MERSDMPNKICRSCHASVGPRSFKCSVCGSPFEGTIKKSQRMVFHNNSPTTTYNINIPISPQPQPAVATTLKPQMFSNNVGTLNLDPGDRFDDLYGKTDALSIIMASLAVYNQTRGRNRYHSLLIGGPSAGKTEMLNRIEETVGKENVLRFNSESASKAGIEEMILTYPSELPPVLIVEEIEKCPNPDSLGWMLPALDTRMQVEKVTAKEGPRSRPVPFISIGSCNSLAKLEKMHSGSIA